MIIVVDIHIVVIQEKVALKHVCIKVVFVLNYARGRIEVLVAGKKIYIHILKSSCNFSSGKGAKVTAVNLKMGTYNYGKFKGAIPYTVNKNGVKPYIVNQNWAKVTSLLGRIKQTFSIRELRH